VSKYNFNISAFVGFIVRDGDYVSMILKCRLDNHSVSTTFSREYIRSDVMSLSDGSENASRHRVEVVLLNVRCVKIGL
jgi:hypothetical protein